MSSVIINPYAFGAGAAPAFSPDDIAGLRLWLDADDASTIALSGSNVTQWNDKSTSANHATQGTTSLQPTRVASGLNGRAVVRFDGTADRMACGSAVWTGSAARSLFVVYKSNRTGTFVDSIAGQSDGTTNQTWFTIQSRTQSVVGDPYLAGYAADLTGPTPDNAWKIATATYNGTTAFSYKNGAQVNTGALTLNTTNTAFRLGYALGAEVTNWLLGDIAEVICYDTALGTTDRDNVHDYLSGKWGVTLA